jgi:hypothetical protein
LSAERTRSRDSPTALSGRPTRVKATLPGEICTCTSIGSASTPENATVATRTTIARPIEQVDHARRQEKTQEHIKNIFHEQKVMPASKNFSWTSVAQGAQPRQS